MAYVKTSIAKAALSDIQTGTLLLPPVGKRWKRKDWVILNRILAISAEVLSIAANERKATDYGNRKG